MTIVDVAGVRFGCVLTRKLGVISLVVVVQEGAWFVVKRFGSLTGFFSEFVLTCKLDGTSYMTPVQKRPKLTCGSE